MKQHGFTLIELLVGMVIAMLCMVMLLTLFAQITRIGGQATRDADYDAQLETGLLIAQKLIQNAGYGSGKSNDIATGFVTFSSTATANATTTGRPAIFWRMATSPDGTSFECSGLAETVTPNGNNYIHRLMYLTKAGCDGPAAPSPANPNLNSMSGWSASPIIKITVNTADVAEAAAAANPVITKEVLAQKAIFSFTLASSPSESCSPFGLPSIQKGAKVTFTGARLNNSSGIGNTITHSVCLRNIPIV